MKQTKTTVGALATGVALSMGCGSSSGGGAPPPAPVLPPSQPLVGCVASRPAVAHHGGAKAIDPTPAGAPVPCSSSTGMAAWDPTLVLTQSGKVLFGPAQAPGLAMSGNNGMTWAALAPLPSPPGGTLYHPWLWRDAASKRIFFNLFGDSGTCPDGTGATLWFSDDEGTTWTNQPVGCGSKDWGKVVTGPPATAASKSALAASGFPNVVYYSATGPDLFLGPDHMLFRSLDGGKTFTRTAKDPDDTVGFPTSGTVGPDGTVYFPVGSPNGLTVTFSKDEGDTWKTTVIKGSSFRGDFAHEANWLSFNVTTDSAGNVYVTWTDDKDLLPYISVSRDGAATWSAPVMIAPAGVEASAMPNITAKIPGYVAIEYYGSPQAMAAGGANAYTANDGRPYTAYVTVTTNLFAAAPTFWTATINDPATPVFMGRDASTSEYAGYPVFAEDGTIWAAFISGGNGLAARVTAPPND
jgi:hypothetical protein